MLGTFASDLSLWDLLKHFEKGSDGKLNLTERVGAPLQEDRGVKRKQGDVSVGSGYQQPVLIFMQSEVRLCIQYRTDVKFSFRSLRTKS